MSEDTVQCYASQDENSTHLDMQEGLEKGKKSYTRLSNKRQVISLQEAGGIAEHSEDYVQIWEGTEDYSYLVGSCRDLMLV